MPHITVEDAQAWAEKTKLPLSVLDDDLEEQVAEHVLGKLRPQFDVSGWADEDTTPLLIRSVMGMVYTSWFYSRTYSEDENRDNEYAIRLLGMAYEIITGLIEGSIELPDDEDGDLHGGTTPLFYPNDASSALEPTRDDPSLGPSKFTMGSIW